MFTNRFALCFLALVCVLFIGCASPAVVVNPPAVIVPSQPMSSATVAPSATQTATSTPVLTETMTASPTLTPVPPMTWQEVRIYMGENCMWMSLEEDEASYFPGATFADTPQGQVLLTNLSERGFSPEEITVRAFSWMDLGIDRDDGKWACVYAIIIPDGDTLTTYEFLNDRGKVVSVSLK